MANLMNNPIWPAMAMAAAAGLLSACSQETPKSPQAVVAAAGPTGSWEAATIAGLATVKPGSTLVFGADGKVSGSGSCNSFGGTYKLSGDDGLEFGPLATTRKACAPDVMAQENAYLKALGDVRKWRVDSASGQLSLANSGGEALVALSAK